MVNREKPTRGQLERAISQQFQKLYREHLGHSTGKVSCQLCDNKLLIVVENSLTQPEQLLLQETTQEKVEQLRMDLDDIVRPKLINLVEEILEQRVVDLLSDTTLETGRSGFVIILSDKSQLPSSSPPDTAKVS